MIELIIVMAIMAVLAGVIGLGISMISGKAAQKCAQQVVYALERTKTASMGKNVDAVYYTIRVESDGSIVGTQTVDGNDSITALGDRSVEFYYKIDGGSYTQLASGSSLQLRYDRTTGGFRTALLNGTDIGRCVGLKATRAGKEYTIKLVPLTGKAMME